MLERWPFLLIIVAVVGAALLWNYRQRRTYADFFDAAINHAESGLARFAQRAGGTHVSGIKRFRDLIPRVDRYDELAGGIGKFGAEAPKALALLVSRGVTAAVVAEAKAPLTALTQVAARALPPSFEEQQGELDQAEAAMWAWYLEWSQIARVAIKQRALLKELGFLNTRRGAEEEEEGEGAAPSAPPRGRGDWRDARSNSTYCAGGGQLRKGQQRNEHSPKVGIRHQARA